MARNLVFIFNCFRADSSQFLHPKESQEMNSQLVSMVIFTVLVASSAFPFYGKHSICSGTESLESDDVAVDQVMAVQTSWSSPEIPL